ncbi:MAG: carboxypeptidase-like regulatory domain-containing protein [bacterium]
MRKRQFTSFVYLFFIFVFLCFTLVSCGGGGIGSVSVGGVTGGLNGYVQVPDGAQYRVVDSDGGRLTAKGVAGAQVVVNTAAGAYVTSADKTGRFSFISLPAGDFMEVAATFSGIEIKMYVSVEKGKIISKDINPTTTAAAVVYEKLKSQNNTVSSIQELESSNLILDLATEIENSLINGTYDYDFLKDSQAVADIIARINSGASLADTTPPVVSIVTPADGSEILDSDFVSDDFIIKVSYADDDSIPDTIASPISATLELDSGAKIDIPVSYFEEIPSSTGFEVQTLSLKPLTGQLIDITSNLKSYTAAITVSFTDVSYNTGTAASSFTIVPDVLNPPE